MALFTSLGFSSVLLWTWIDRHVTRATSKRVHIHQHFISTKTHDPTTAEDSYGVRELRDGYQMCDLAEVNPGATLSGGMTPLSSQSNPALFCPTSYNTLVPPNVFPPNPCLVLYAFTHSFIVSLLFLQFARQASSLSLTPYGAPSGSRPQSSTFS